MAAALVTTARAAAQVVTDDSSCDGWVAVLAPLADYCNVQPNLSLHLVADSALCFLDDKARKAYHGDDPACVAGAVTWSTMEKKIRVRDQTVPRLFLCASTYQTVGTGSTADDWHCILVMKLDGAFHIFSTGAGPQPGVESIRIGQLTGMSVFKKIMKDKPHPITAYFLPDRAEKTCVADSLRAAIHIFEAVEVQGVGAAGILAYQPLMRGRQTVTVAG